MKLMGFLCMTFCGFYAGQLFSRRLVRRVKLLTTLKLLISTIGMQIKFMSAEIYDIVYEIYSRGNFSKLVFLKHCIEYTDKGMDFPSAWENGIEEDEMVLLLEGDEVELLRSFGASLGTTDTEGQVGICNMYEKLIDDKLSEAIQKKQQCSKLYTGLGTLLGIGAAILTLY